MFAASPQIGYKESIMNTLPSSPDFLLPFLIGGVLLILGALVFFIARTYDDYRKEDKGSKKNSDP